MDLFETVKANVSVPDAAKSMALWRTGMGWLGASFTMIGSPV